MPSKHVCDILTFSEMGDKTLISERFNKSVSFEWINLCPSRKQGAHLNLLWTRGGQGVFPHLWTRESQSVAPHLNLLWTIRTQCVAPHLWTRRSQSIIPGAMSENPSIQEGEIVILHSITLLNFIFYNLSLYRRHTLEHENKILQRTKITRRTQVCH